MSLLKIELNNQLVSVMVKITYKAQGIVKSRSWTLREAPDSVRKIIKTFQEGQTVWVKHK